MPALGLGIGLPFNRVKGIGFAPGFILQRLIGSTDGVVLEDRKDLVHPRPKTQAINCLVSSGAQTISSVNIANGAVVVNAGTAVGTATTGVITFTSGTISQLQLDGVMTYACDEGATLPLDVSGKGNDITSMTCTWGTSDTLTGGSWNYSKGCSPPVAPDLSLGWRPTAPGYGGFDIRNVNYSTRAQDVTLVTDGDTVKGFGFSEDGTILVVCDTNSEMFSYTCNTPWDVTSLTPIAVHYITPSVSNVDFHIDPTGTHITLWGVGTDIVSHYELTTPWDITTNVFRESKVLGQAQATLGIWVSKDGTKLVVMGWAGVTGSSLYRYDTPFDASTLVFVQADFIQSVNVIQRMCFSEDGTTVICATNGSAVYQYTFSEPWDFSTVDAGIVHGGDTIYWNAGVWMNNDQSLLYTLRDNKHMRVYNTNQGAGASALIVPALGFPSSSVASFDGTGDYIETLSLTVPETFSYITNLIPTTKDYAVYFAVGMATMLRQKTDGSVEARYNNTTYTSATGVLSVGVLTKVEYRVTDGLLQVFVDEVEILNKSITNVEMVSTVNIGRRVATDYFNGQMRDALMTGVFTYELPDIVGKYVDTVVLDTSGNGNNATAFSTDIGAFWGTRIADADGLIVDAAGYLPITQPAGPYHNDFGGAIIEDPAAFRIIDEIVVTDSEGVHRLFIKLDGNGDPVLFGGHAEYVEVGSGGVTMFVSGVNWRYVLTDAVGAYENPTLNTFPPKTGTWTLISGSGDAPTDIAYESYLVEASEFVPKTLAQDLVRLNASELVVDQWEKTSGACVIRERQVYSQGTVMDGAWIQAAEMWATKYTDECGEYLYAMRDNKGVLVLDQDGEPILLTPP